MKQNQMVESLKKEAASNKATNDVLFVFSNRERARQILTVSGLKQRMKAKGFDYSDDKYGEVLTTMAAAGVGTLQKDAKGRVHALKDIKITLNSLGKAVLNAEKVKGFTPKNTYVEVKVPQTTEVIAAPKGLTTGSLKLGVYMKDRLINIEVPSNLSSEELAALIHKFQEVA